jgi:hypothetical protein
MVFTTESAESAGRLGREENDKRKRREETEEEGLRRISEGQVLLELKVVERLLPVHQAQILSYLRLSQLPLGLLINFHCATLKEGLRRFRNSHSNPSPSALSALSVVKNR